MHAVIASAKVPGTRLKAGWAVNDREVYSELAPMAHEFARQSLETVDAADRAVLDRTLKKLSKRSAKLAADIANRPSPR